MEVERQGLLDVLDPSEEDKLVPAKEEKLVPAEEELVPTEEECVVAPPPSHPVVETPVHRTNWRGAWLYATVVLCCYGFFKEFKPSEPFLTPYLVDFKNFTKSEVNSKIYPYWPYSYLIAAFFTFLLTDILRYVPVILLESLAYLGTRILLVWGSSVMDMRWMQIVYGVATATEIAYFSFIYTAVPLDKYKTVTSSVRAIRLVGQSSAGLLGQLLVSTNVFSYLGLNYISLGSVGVACFFALLLPFTYAIDPEAAQCSTTRSSKNNFFLTEVKNRFSDFLKFYSQFSLLKWSLWWALAMCGVLQVGNYVQSLWKEVASSSGVGHEYNGVVEAVATLLSAGAATLVSLMKVNWSLWGELTIGVLSVVDSLLLLLASHATQLWGVYLCHILYRSTYTFLITVASTQLALRVDHNSYAFIFGFNTFLALVFQTIFTVVVADEHGLDLPIRTQFVVYSGYYFLLTLLFVGAGVYKLTSRGWLRSVRVCCKENSPPAEPPESHQVFIQAQDEDEEETSSVHSVDKLV